MLSKRSLVQLILRTMPAVKLLFNLKRNYILRELQSVSDCFPMRTNAICTNKTKLDHKSIVFCVLVAFSVAAA